MIWHRLDNLRKGRWIDLVGLGLVTIVALVYLYRGIGEVQHQARVAQSQGLFLTVGVGDVMARDLPKANSLLHDNVFADPHYKGEVQWYPCITPLVVWVFANLSGQTLSLSYLFTGVIFSALMIFAIGLFLRVNAGKIGFVVLPLCLAHSIWWPGNGYYPFDIAQLPLVLFLLLVGRLFIHIDHMVLSEGWQEKRVHTMFLFALLGLINGLFFLWHGASFVTATFLSASLILYYMAQSIRVKRLSTLLWPLAFFFAGFALFVSLQVVPQLVHYHRFQQSDSARLWLAEIYQGGNQPFRLLGLELVPGGWSGFTLLILAIAVLGLRLKQFQLLTLLLAYAFTKVWAHWGFVVHSIEYPWMANLSRNLLWAPPHTFNAIGNSVFSFVVLLVIAILFCRLIESISKLRIVSHIVLTGTFVLPNILFLFCLIVAYLILLLNFPPNTPPYVDTVDLAQVDFANEVSRLTGATETVIGVLFFPFAPMKLLYANAPDHSNPYVEAERARAQAILDKMSPDAAAVQRVIDHYGIHYLVTPDTRLSMVAKLCGDQVLLRSPRAGYQLMSLKTCQNPFMGAETILEKVRNANVLLESESPPLAKGVVFGADNFLTFTHTASRGLALMKLVVTGQSFNASPAEDCLTTRIIFRGMEGELGETSASHPVSDDFLIEHWFVTPERTTLVIPRVSFQPACFEGGLEIQIDSVGITSEFAPTTMYR